MHRARLFIFGGAIYAGFLMAACGGGSTERTPDVLALEGVADEGAAVYEGNCADCHGADGAGPVGLAHLDDHDDAALSDQILAGSLGMPAFDDKLTDQEVADIIAFLRTL